MLLVQLASINYFYSMWQLEDSVFYKSLSLPWGSFQPACSCIRWNKWLEISHCLIFYLRNTNTIKLNYNANSKVPKWNSHIWHQNIIDRLWSYLLNFLNYFYILMHQIFLYKLKGFKILQALLNPPTTDPPTIDQ